VTQPHGHARIQRPFKLLVGFSYRLNKETTLIFSIGAGLTRDKPDPRAGHQQADRVLAFSSVAHR
jgi:hypothetical protein